MTPLKVERPAFSLGTEDHPAEVSMFFCMVCGALKVMQGHAKPGTMNTPCVGRCVQRGEGTPHQHLAYDRWSRRFTTYA